MIRVIHFSAIALLAAASIVIAASKGYQDPLEAAQGFGVFEDRAAVHMKLPHYAQPYSVYFEVIDDGDAGSDRAGSVSQVIDANYVSTDEASPNVPSQSAELPNG